MTTHTNTHTHKQFTILMNCTVFVVMKIFIYIQRAKSDKGYKCFFMYIYDRLVEDKNNSSSDIAQVKRDVVVDCV